MGGTDFVAQAKQLEYQCCPPESTVGHVQAADRRLISRPHEDCYLSGQLQLPWIDNSEARGRDSGISKCESLKFLLYTARAILPRETKKLVSKKRPLLRPEAANSGYGSYGHGLFVLMCSICKRMTNSHSLFCIQHHTRKS